MSRQWSTVATNQLQDPFNHKSRTWVRSNYKPMDGSSVKTPNLMSIPTRRTDQRDPLHRNRQTMNTARSIPSLMNLPTRNYPNKSYRPENREVRTNRMHRYTPVSSDYTRLVKLLFRLTQVTHHLKIWEASIPAKIDNQIEELFGMIMPPHPSEDLKRNLKRCQQNTKTGISDVVLQHLIQSLAETKKSLSYIQCTNDGDMAARVAQEQLKRFGNKMTKEFIRNTLLEGLRILGSNWISEEIIVDPPSLHTPTVPTNPPAAQELPMDTHQPPSPTSWVLIDEITGSPLKTTVTTPQMVTDNTETTRKRNRSSAENRPHQSPSVLPKKYRTGTPPLFLDLESIEQDDQQETTPIAMPRSRAEEAMENLCTTFLENNDTILDPISPTFKLNIELNLDNIIPTAHQPASMDSQETESTAVTDDGKIPAVLQSQENISITNILEESYNLTTSQENNYLAESTIKSATIQEPCQTTETDELSNTPQSILQLQKLAEIENNDSSTMSTTLNNDKNILISNNHNNTNNDTTSQADTRKNCEQLFVTMEGETTIPPTATPFNNTDPQFQMLRPGANNIAILTLDLDPTFNTVLIGDSNLRLLGHCKLPTNWQVFGIGGLRIDHTTNLFKLALGPRPHTIILALGINNKEAFFKTNTSTHIDTMIQNLHKYFPSSRKVAVGISARDLPPRTMSNIEMINNKLESIFGVNYVKPLPTTDITLLEDKYKIHHDQVTVGRILNSIISILN